MCLVGIGGVFLVIVMLLLFSSYESTYFLDVKFEVGELGEMYINILAANK